MGGRERRTRQGTFAYGGEAVGQCDGRYAAAGQQQLRQRGGGKAAYALQGFALVGHYGGAAEVELLERRHAVGYE